MTELRYPHTVRQTGEGVVVEESAGSDSRRVLIRRDGSVRELGGNAGKADSLWVSGARGGT